MKLYMNRLTKVSSPQVFFILCEQKRTSKAWGDDTLVNELIIYHAETIVHDAWKKDSRSLNHSVCACLLGECCWDWKPGDR